MLFGRPPNAEETSAATEYLAKVREKLSGSTPSDQLAGKVWESLTRGLLMSNEFVYVD